jgi:tripartite-type tricarboxylate transporter receptor subunit TctC
MAVMVHGKFREAVMRSMRNWSRAVIMLAFVVASCAVHAETYPSRPIRLVNPYPAGASTDILGRLIAQRLAELLGQNVVPDNRPGAGGNLGAVLVAKATPNGYTVLITSPTIAISPSLYSNLGYNAEKELAPVARLAAIHNILLVRPSLPVKTLRQFVDLARSQPGKLNFGSGGAGTTNHLANELLMSLEKIKLVHVPYKGASLAVTALIGNEVDEAVISANTVVDQIRSGKVRALAVLSEQRLALLPDIPTAIEAGVKDFVMPFWAGMFAPAATPREIIVRLSQAVTTVLKAPDFRDKLAATGFDPWPGTADDMARLLKSETIRYAEIIKNAGLRAE